MYPDDELLPAEGLLYVGDEVLLVLELLADELLLLTDELALLVRLPTLIPPLTVPLVTLTELDVLPVVALLPAAAHPEPSVRARRPW